MNAGNVLALLSHARQVRMDDPLLPEAVPKAVHYPVHQSANVAIVHLVEVVPTPVHHPTPLDPVRRPLVAVVLPLHPRKSS